MTEPLAGRAGHPVVRALYDLIESMHVEASVNPDLKAARIRAQAVDIDHVRVAYIIGTIDLDHAWAMLDAGRIQLAQLRTARVFQGMTEHIKIARQL